MSEEYEASGNVELTEEDKEKIRQRLIELGYL